MSSIRAVSALALCVAIGTPAHGQMAPAPGRLLVADSNVVDPDFAETVLLILIHQDGGSIAVFLNRPTWVEPAEAFPEIEALVSYDGALYLGGSVGPAELLTVFEADGPPERALSLGDGIFLSPNPELLSELDLGAVDRPNIRLYAGHAEWGPGQLASEVAAGRWRVLRSEPGHIFTDDPSSLWENLVLAPDGVSAAIF
ncbi:MAG TPA: YqgE/AlgH family protein [Gammaproteobacteria bacterium]|nr:YqgE/AlgH family protein [Gammaproteobacteria bacterium]